MDQQNWQKIRLLYTALQKKSYWYTGLSLKRYLKTKVFNLLPDFKNSALTAGRFSAYAHYSIIQSFKNLLEKNQIQKGSNVIAHPLLPEYLVEEILKLEANVEFLDISKKNWNFLKVQINQKLNTNSLQTKAEKIDLIIVYGFNGLYEEIAELATLAFSRVIPVLAVIDSPYINQSLLKLFDNLKLGSVLWQLGDSFFDDHLDQVLDRNLPTQPWFISWHIETRTQSILEYHLTQSYEKVVPLMEAYLYILLEEEKKKKFWMPLMQLGLNRLLFSQKFTSVATAKKTIIEKYHLFYEIALPDIVFELQLSVPINQAKFEENYHLLNHHSAISDKAKLLYDFFCQNYQLRPVGSVEIPDFYLDRLYLNYFIYTTESQFWHQKLLQEVGLPSFSLPKPHTLVTENPNLKKANFVKDFSLLIELNKIN